MFFFYKYIRPEWYFLVVSSKDGPIYFPDYDTIDEEIKSGLTLDPSFESLHARKWDLAYQVFQQGVLVLEQCKARKLEYGLDIPLSDNYKFIHKHFNSGWVLYILVLRLLSFHNPIKEIFCCLTVLGRRYTYTKAIIRKGQQNQVRSDKLDYTVSIIIPTLNRYVYLYDALKDLEVQTHEILEVIVIDQSDKFDDAFYKEINLPLRIIRQNGHGQWLARNKAIQEAKGDLIALYEDDIRVEKDWISNHIDAIVKYNSDISSGRLLKANLSMKIEKDGDVHYAHYFPAGNAFVKRIVFQKIGLFDRQYDGMRWGDGDWGMRAYLAGYKNILNEKAFCIDQQANTGGLRDMKSRSGYKTMGFSIRPVPSVFYFLLKYYGLSHLFPSITLHLPGTIFSNRKVKMNYVMGLFIVILFFPYWLAGGIISFQKAKRMLKEESKIEYLE
ncbi:MAG: glycosyltransferase family 2 protein [Chitinophagaceae bacterium]|nr:glycosyltransferase family 2 protein [Chitinophagaceae bacterium]